MSQWSVSKYVTILLKKNKLSLRLI